MACSSESDPVSAPSLPTPPSPVVDRLTDGVFAVYPTEGVKANALPSYALLDPYRMGTGASNDDLPVNLTFFSETTEDGLRYGVRFTVEAGTSLYGLGEVPGPLERRSLQGLGKEDDEGNPTSKKASMWATDAFAYDRHQEAMYQVHPWVLAVRPDGTSFGVLFDTTWRAEVDIQEHEVIAIADGPAFPAIVMTASTPQVVLTRLAEQTGFIPMPPLWALGYHQSRWSYLNEFQAMNIANEFRTRQIPADVLWLDIDYMFKYQVFTFDRSRFSDPKKFNQDLANIGFHNVWMIDPGVSAEPQDFNEDTGYWVYEELVAGDHGVKTDEGELYRQGIVWPGRCVFPDYTDPRTRQWWAGLYEDYMAQGIDGVWNDMNEPTVFNSNSEKTFHDGVVHRGDPDMGGDGPHDRFHNVYGMLMVRGTREGIEATQPDRRHFILSRANYIGGQRYAAMWTGDNSATWWDLDVSIPMVLNMGLSGQPFAGPDIGGFVEDGTPELFGRWIGVGAYYPFSRGHAERNTAFKEPWRFGEEVEATAKAALENRYIIMPYLYTLFYEAHTTGVPVMRPVFFADLTDPNLRAEDQSFLLGRDLLIEPDLTENRTTTSTLPKTNWRQFTLQGADDPDVPNMYLRPGSILPTGPIMQYTQERPLDPLTLIVHLDDNQTARGWLYEDAGDGFGYQNGEYLITRYVARVEGDTLVVDVEDTEGDWPRPDRSLTVRLLLPDGEERLVEGTDGQLLTIPL